jgi:hypothetical protein
MEALAAANLEAASSSPRARLAARIKPLAVFNERFKELTEDEQLIHFSATVLVTIAIALIMTPRRPIGRANDNIQVFRMARHG